MNRDVYIIIPAYNEAQMVGSVIKELKKHFQNVVCVNDGSSDNTSQVILEAGGGLVEHPINLGAGAATQTGIEYALQDPKAKIFVTFDGDGQHSVKDIAPLIKHLKENDLDVVFGSRFLGKIENISPLKEYFLTLVRLFNRFTTKVELSDPHIGLRVFNRRFAESLDITLHGFAHASEIVEHIGDGNFRYGEHPVTVMYTDYSLKKGQPMLNSVNILFDLFFNKVLKK